MYRHPLPAVVVAILVAVTHLSPRDVTCHITTAPRFQSSILYYQLQRTIPGRHISSRFSVRGRNMLVIIAREIMTLPDTGILDGVEAAVWQQFPLWAPVPAGVLTVFSTRLKSSLSPSSPSLCYGSRSCCWHAAAAAEPPAATAAPVRHLPFPVSAAKPRNLPGTPFDIWPRPGPGNGRPSVRPPEGTHEGNPVSSNVR